MKREYISDLPYPEVKISDKNRKYVCTLEELYAGSISELTSVHQLLYQNIAIDNCDDDLKEALDMIALSEMHHLKMLGDMINQLGGDHRFLVCHDPRCSKGKPIYWHAAYVSYSRMIKRMMIDNIDSKQKKIKKYKNAVNTIENEEITTVLKRILMDEEKHLEIFTEFYEKYK